MSKNIIVVGALGDWGGKITEQLKQSGHDVLALDKTSNALVGADKKANSKEYDTAIIASQPCAHTLNIKQIKKGFNCKKIIVEKPNPDLSASSPNFEQLEDDVLFVDHYLYKSHIDPLKEYFEEHKNNISKVSINVCETAFESRSWMQEQNKGGGVVYDLAHHAVAIAMHLFPCHSIIEALSSLKLEQFTTFNSNRSAAENFVSFNLLIDKVELVIRVGKQCQFQQKNVVLSSNEESKIFSLNDSVSYQDIVQKPHKLLDKYMVCEINVVLQQVLLLISEEKYQTLKMQNPEPQSEACLDKDKHIEMLADMFKHRHLYYWSTYFRVTLYFVIMIISPFLAYYYMIGKVENASYILPVLSIGTVSVILYLVPRVVSFLEAEDIRLVIVHKRYKELLNSIGINIEAEAPKKKVRIGNHMLVVFKTLIWLLSGVSVVASICHAFIW